MALSQKIIKNPHTRLRQNLSVRKSCIRNNHSKGRFLIPILSRKEDKKNRNTITVIPLTSKPGYDNLPLEFNLADGLSILTMNLIKAAEDRVKHELVTHFGEYDDFDELSQNWRKKADQMRKNVQ